MSNGLTNLHADLRFPTPVSAAVIAGSLLDQLESQLTQDGIQIAHLKIFDNTPFGWVRAGVTSNGGEPVPEGDLLADPAVDHLLVINLRALADPLELQCIVTQVIEGFGAPAAILHLGSFRPKPPVPAHRFVESAPLSSGE